MSGCRDPFNRQFFHEEEFSPLEHYRTLCSLRNRSDALRNGSARFSAYGNDIIIIKRCKDKEAYTAVINRSEEPIPVRIDEAGKDLLSGRVLGMEFQAEGRSAYIIQH